MKHGSIATLAERVGTVADSMTIPRWTYGTKLQEAGYVLAAMTVWTKFSNQQQLGVHDYVLEEFVNKQEYPDFYVYFQGARGVAVGMREKMNSSSVRLLRPFPMPFTVLLPLAPL